MVAQDAHSNDPHGHDSHALHAHAAPTSFIRKYIFSLDHKVIGLQYYFLALTAVFVGMFLSLLMRIHMVWPSGRSAVDRRDQAGNLSQPAHHARHHHGVLCADHGAAGRIRQLLSANSDRRAGHGVSGPEHAFVLDHFRRVHGHTRRLLRYRGRSTSWLDRLCPAKRVAERRPRRATRRGSVDYQHCHLLRRVVDGCAELYYHGSGSTGQGHDHDAHAADCLVMVHHRDPRTAGFRRPAFGRHPACCWIAISAPAFMSRWW